MEEAAKKTLEAEVARLDGKGVWVRGLLKKGIAWEEILEAEKRSMPGSSSWERTDAGACLALSSEA